jgi:hypothetical protein
MKWQVAVLLVAAHALRAAAQSPPSVPPIDTDRPDLTDGTGVVPRRMVQFETGLTAQAARDGVTAWSVPELLVRVGVVRGAELRIAETWRSVGASGNARAEGLDDLQLGTKIALMPQRSWPAVSVEAFTTMATGAAGVGAGGALPGAALLLQQTSSGPWSAGIELEVSRGLSNPLAGFASLSIQFQATARIQWYGEYYQLVPDLARAGREHYVNSGLLVLLDNDLQVDARVGVGLNRAADRSYMGVGLSVRR